MADPVTETTLEWVLGGFASIAILAHGALWKVMIDGFREMSRRRESDNKDFLQALARDNERLILQSERSDADLRNDIIDRLGDLKEGTAKAVAACERELAREVAPIRNEIDRLRELSERRVRREEYDKGVSDISSEFGRLRTRMDRLERLLSAKGRRLAREEDNGGT